MVFNHDLIKPKQLFHAILVADLTPEQLDVVHTKFGNGATMMTPRPQWQLFIEDRRELASRSHADIKRFYPDIQPLIVVDAGTPGDGGIWYLDRFASDSVRWYNDAENENTLFKVRMRLEDVVICFVRIALGHWKMKEIMSSVNIPVPVPENFTQKELYSSGFDPVKHRYKAGDVAITATPDEFEAKPPIHPAQPAAVHNIPRYRMKDDVCVSHGFRTWGHWSQGPPAQDVELPDGTLVKFPKGSKTFWCNYDPEFVEPVYWKPAGSL